MTVLPLAMLLPLSGFVLITSPVCTVELLLLHDCGTRPAALICATAWACGSPFTCGT